LIYNYQNVLAGTTNAILYSLQNYKKNINFKGSCTSDKLPLLKRGASEGDCYYCTDTNLIMVWTGTGWVEMPTTIPDPGTFEIQDPEQPKSEEEKLNDIADALTLLALS